MSVDVIGSGARSYGRLELYNDSGVLLERVTTTALASGQVQTLELGRPVDDVSYVLVRGHMGSGVKLDNLRYGPKTTATTDSFGRYGFANLTAGSYRVQVDLTGVTSQVTSAGGQQQVVVVHPSQPAVQHLDFGINFRNTPWHNVNWAEDVNDDGYVTALDALLVVNLLNQSGTNSALAGSALPHQPYVDVSNDGYITAIDALLIINALNRGVGDGGGVETIVGDETLVAADPPAEAVDAFLPIFDPYSDPLGSCRRIGAKLGDFLAT